MSTDDSSGLRTGKGFGYQNQLEVAFTYPRALSRVIFRNFP